MLNVSLQVMTDLLKEVQEIRDGYETAIKRSEAVEAAVSMLKAAFSESQALRSVYLSKEYDKVYDNEICKAARRGLTCVNLKLSPFTPLGVIEWEEVEEFFTMLGYVVSNQYVPGYFEVKWGPKTNNGVLFAMMSAYWEGVTHDEAPPQTSNSDDDSGGAGGKQRAGTDAAEVDFQSRMKHSDIVLQQLSKRVAKFDRGEGKL